MRTKIKRWGLIALAIVGGYGATTSLAQQVDEEVIVTAPGGSVATEASRFPGNVQSATDLELRESGALNLNEFLGRSLGSVHINDAQNNPYQPELFYRGFGTSPLLGFPQGLSIYTDGVRRNELFGDVVNWDTIPDSALARVDLIPGSNPVFGLNTLGGAIAMQTKSGLSHPGTRAEAFGGSFGRFTGQVETGGGTSDLGWFFALDGFTEDGWRDFSDSDLVQAFGKLSWQGDRVDTDLALTLTDSELRGNGAAPEELLALEGREAVFTHPDITENQMAQLNLRSLWRLRDDTTLTAIAYYRRTDTDTFNGDGSEFQECEEFAGLTCEEEGDEEELARNQFGDPIAFTDAVEGGTENSSKTEQDAVGASLQAVFDRPLGATEHELLVGGSVDFGDADFSQQTELARLTEDRGTVGSGFIVEESLTDVNSEIFHGSLFLADNIALSERLDLTLSARFNHTDIKLRDRRNPGGDDGEDEADADLDRVRLDEEDDDDGGDPESVAAEEGLDEDDDEESSLNGDHEFNRLNPAIALTFRALDELSVYGSWSQSNRAPTPAELTCANPDDPCRLPNAFVDDPPLEQVITQTIELGARGNLPNGWRWNATLFRAVSDDDILFISAGTTTTQGFFANVGETRRQGIELGLQGEAGPASFGAYYTYVDAEFRDGFLTNSPNHPLRNPLDEDLPALAALRVESGDRIPGVPEHLLRVNLAVDVTDRLTVGADAVAQSDQVFRGDESNTAEELDGFVVVNANARYRFSDRVEAVLRVNNLFDTDYETFGVFGEADEVLGEEFEDARRFVGPGAPLGAWLGVRVSL